MNQHIDMGDVNALFILWKYFTDALKQKHSDVLMNFYDIFYIMNNYIITFF